MLLGVRLILTRLSELGCGQHGFCCSCPGTNLVYFFQGESIQAKQMIELIIEFNQQRIFTIQVSETSRFNNQGHRD